VIDTHAHLDACEAPAEELVARAGAAGVGRVITVGSGIDSCRKSLAIAARHEGVYAALGIHPHQAGSDEAEQLDDLRSLLADERAVAVGETGLDYFRHFAPRDRQRELFERQLLLASELGLPVVIHCRDADDDVAGALASFGGTVVLHCFSSPPLLTPALERGYYVSFAGNVTFPKAEELRTAAARVSADRLLAETDSPYLAPQPVRGKRNEPANVVHTLATLAEARKTTPPELAEQIDANATAAFALSVRVAP
jgi:TatD DNase family protein